MTDAAARLGVSITTVRLWQQTYGFPSELWEGGDPRYDAVEIAALAAALDNYPSLAGAIERARRMIEHQRPVEPGSGPPQP